MATAVPSGIRSIAEMNATVVTPVVTPRATTLSRSDGE